MRLSIVTATLEGCPAYALADAEYVRHLIEEAVSVGGFTLLHCYVHESQAQGVSGAAVLSESHLAIHTWPEQGVLLLDIATCSGAEPTRAAFARICALVPHQRIEHNGLSLRGPSARHHQRSINAGSAPCL